MIKVSNIKLSLDEDLNAVQDKAAAKAGVKPSDVNHFKILKESIDARKKNNIFLVYQAEFECKNEEAIVRRSKDPDVILQKQELYDETASNVQKLKLRTRPIVIGSGPAGLFAGLILAQNGFRPILLERGASVEQRDLKIKEFFKSGVLDPECNIQFGEGGAGTYSDGKLTTRIKDTRCDFVLDTFVNAGAPNEIAYSFKPHIGTDILVDVVRNIRKEIIKLGGEVRFFSKLTNLNVENGKLRSIEVNGSDEMECEALVLAIGHSARDTYEMLLAKQVQFEQKPFAIGLRIEHLQSMIDESQYGGMANHPKLKGASYKLAYTSSSSGRSCYSFCMCPGGVVVAAASETERLVVNGMSEYARDMANANSAIVVGVAPADFGSAHPLAGVEFQRHYEQLAFRAGGGGFKAPVQLVGDFLKDTVSSRIGEVQPSYPIDWSFADLSSCLPSYVTQTIKEGLTDFDRKLKGFASYHSVLTGIETRTSSPIRIVRNEEYEATKVSGLYPAGEGAGYAGGIVSAAVDGIKVAEKIMHKYFVEG